jgi:hypothetical protein
MRSFATSSKNFAASFFMIQKYNNYSNNSNAVQYNLIKNMPATAIGSPHRTPSAIRIKIMPVI